MSGGLSSMQTAAVRLVVAGAWEHDVEGAEEVHCSSERVDSGYRVSANRSPMPENASERAERGKGLRAGTEAGMQQTQGKKTKKKTTD